MSVPEVEVLPHVDPMKRRVQPRFLRTLRPRHLRDRKQHDVLAVMDVVASYKRYGRSLSDEDHVVRRSEPNEAYRFSVSTFRSNE